MPCLPVALNSGLYWSRRKFLRRPGTIVVEILDLIPPGLPRDAFFQRDAGRIETASDRLVAEGRRAKLGCDRWACRRSLRMTRPPADA